MASLTPAGLKSSDLKKLTAAHAKTSKLKITFKPLITSENAYLNKNNFLNSTQRLVSVKTLCHLVKALFSTQLGHLSHGHYSYGMVKNLMPTSLAIQGFSHRLGMGSQEGCKGQTHAMAVTEAISFSFTPGLQANPAGWRLSGL